MSGLKFILVLISFAFAVTYAARLKKGVLIREAQDMTVRISQDCINNMTLPNDYLFLIGNSFLPTKVEEMCYFQCIFEAFEFIKEGKIDNDAISDLSFAFINKPARKYFLKAASLCTDTTGDSECQAGYDIQRCFLDFYNRYPILDEIYKVL